MTMGQGIQAFASLWIPDLSNEFDQSRYTLPKEQPYAEKSADPVAARVASDESAADQQAPLCPINVPILVLSAS